VLKELMVDFKHNHIFGVEITVVISCLLSPDGGIGRRWSQTPGETVPVRFQVLEKPFD
jgi:hypothetical protein